MKNLLRGNLMLMMNVVFNVNSNQIVSNYTYTDELTEEIATFQRNSQSTKMNLVLNLPLRETNAEVQAMAVTRELPLSDETRTNFFAKAAWLIRLRFNQTIDQ